MQPSAQPRSVATATPPSTAIAAPATARRISRSDCTGPVTSRAITRPGSATAQRARSRPSPVKNQRTNPFVSLEEGVVATGVAEAAAGAAADRAERAGLAAGLARAG